MSTTYFSGTFTYSLHVNFNYCESLTCPSARVEVSIQISANTIRPLVCSSVLPPVPLL